MHFLWTEIIKQAYRNAADGIKQLRVIDMETME